MGRRVGVLERMMAAMARTPMKVAVHVACAARFDKEYQ